MKKKLYLLPLAAAMGLLLGAPAGAAPAEPAVQSGPGTAAPAWLGVAVGPVPQAVQAQLPDDIAQNQGLMVMQVIPRSPAEKSGIQRHDVLLSYNDEKLFTSKDLVRRVRSGKDGDKVTLELVRHGKPMKVEVTLESRQPPAHRRRPMGRGHLQAPPRRPPRPSHMESRAWESFQSLSVVKNSDGKYSAVVEFLDDDGNKKRFEYEGTRDEISAQAKKEKELPPALKRQLLDALSDRMPTMPEFPDFPPMPDFRELERELFAPPPWFRRQGGPGYWN